MVIRKIIIVSLMAVLCNDLINILWFHVEPNFKVVIMSLVVSLYLLFRQLYGTIIVEYYLSLHGGNDGKMG